MKLTPEMILGGIRIEMNIHYPRAGFFIGKKEYSETHILASRDAGIQLEIEDDSIHLYRVCRTLDMSVLIHDPIGFKKLIARMKFLSAKYYGRAFEKIVADAQKLTTKEKRELIKLLSERLEHQEAREAVLAAKRAEVQAKVALDLNLPHTS